MTLVDRPVDDLVERLRSEDDHVWLVGGGRLTRSFLRSNGVDELRVGLVPVLLGRGIPLFGDDGERRDLTLLDATTHGSSIVELHYRLTAARPSESTSA